MAETCRTLVVDDDPDMAFLAASVIHLANAGLVVTGVAFSGEEALEKFPEAAPDVVVLDYRMPDQNGLDVAREILQTTPDQAIVLFSAHLDEATVTEAMRLGVRACLLKNRVKELPELVRELAGASVR